MNEAEIRAELIDPKLKACGWGVVEDSKILCDGYVTNKAYSNYKSLIIRSYLCDGYVTTGNFLFDGYLILKQKLQ